MLDEIERYLEVFRNRSLPKTREEFETRATLLQLLREAKTFIQVKVDFYQKIWTVKKKNFRPTTKGEYLKFSFICKLSP